MDLRRLECFVAVAEELHFRRAAERLHTTQPAVSQQVRQLEEALAVRLLERSRRHVRLTAAGEIYLAEARRVLERLDRAGRLARRAAAGQAGRLALGCTSPALLLAMPELVRRFRQLAPAVEIDLAELPTGEQEAALRRHDLDAGILHPPVDDAALEVVPFFRRDFRLAVPVEHHLAAADAIDLAELAGEPLVLFPRPTAPGLYDAVIARCRDAGFRPRIVLEVAPAHSLVPCVAAGLRKGCAAGGGQPERAGMCFRPIVPPAPQHAIALALPAAAASPAALLLRQAAREIAAAG